MRMRLDKFFTATAVMSRKEAALAVKKGRVTVDGIPVHTADFQFDAEKSVVSLDGEVIPFREFHWIMMNKPAGVVSATDSPDDTVVTDLLPENLQKLGLFPCGRLDKNTTGLILLTNDGQLSHRLLAPKSKTEKEYHFKVKYPLSEEDVGVLENGVAVSADSIAEGFTTAPCKVLPEEDRRGGSIILTEGKYHEIKRMMEAVHNQISGLSRIRFASVSLDKKLKPSEWRYLTKEEEAALRNSVIKNTSES